MLLPLSYLYLLMQVIQHLWALVSSVKQDIKPTDRDAVRIRVVNAQLTAQQCLLILPVGLFPLASGQFWLITKISHFQTVRLPHDAIGRTCVSWGTPDSLKRFSHYLRICKVQQMRTVLPLLNNNSQLIHWSVTQEAEHLTMGLDFPRPGNSIWLWPFKCLLQG